MLGALKCDAFIDLEWSSDAANKPFKALFPSGRLYTGEMDLLQYWAVWKSNLRRGSS